MEYFSAFITRYVLNRFVIRQTAHTNQLCCFDYQYQTSKRQGVKKKKRFIESHACMNQWQQLQVVIHPPSPTLLCINDTRADMAITTRIISFIRILATF